MGNPLANQTRLSAGLALFIEQIKTEFGKTTVIVNVDQRQIKGSSLASARFHLP